MSHKHAGACEQHRVCESEEVHGTSSIGGRAARLKKCWSQQEAAEAIGIDHNTLYRWETGKTTPRGYNLRALCEVYGAMAAELGLDGKKAEREQTVSIVHTERSVPLNTQITQLLTAYTENQQKILTALSEAIAPGTHEMIHELERVLRLNISDEVTRRTLIARLLGMPLALSAWDRQFISSMSEALLFTEKDSLDLYEDILVMGWDGFRRSKSPEIISRIDGYVNKLATLSQDIPEGKREHWQSLLCRFSQLSTRVAQHNMDERRALSMAKQAIDVARSLDDAELIASAFYGRGRVHLESSHIATDERQKQKHFALARADVDAALAYVEKVRIPLKGNIYLIAAEIYASFAQNDASLRTQCEAWQDKVATLIYKGNIENDGTFLKLDRTALHHEKAKTLLRFGRLQAAHHELDTAWETLPPNLLTWQMNMHLTEASLALAKYDVERSSRSSIRAYATAKAIYSHKGQAEVKNLFTDLHHFDPRNTYTRDLGMILGNDL